MGPVKVVRTAVWSFSGVVSGEVSEVGRTSSKRVDENRDLSGAVVAGSIFTPG